MALTGPLSEMSSWYLVSPRLGRDRDIAPASNSSAERPRFDTSHYSDDGKKKINNYATAKRTMTFEPYLELAYDDDGSQAVGARLHSQSVFREFEVYTLH